MVIIFSDPYYWFLEPSWYLRYLKIHIFLLPFLRLTHGSLSLKPWSSWLMRRSIKTRQHSWYHMRTICSFCSCTWRFVMRFIMNSWGGLQAAWFDPTDEALKSAKLAGWTASFGQIFVGSKLVQWVLQSPQVQKQYLCEVLQGHTVLVSSVSSCLIWFIDCSDFPESQVKLQQKPSQSFSFFAAVWRSNCSFVSGFLPALVSARYIPWKILAMSRKLKR